MPMNFTLKPLRHDWNVLSALKNFDCGSSLASGTASAGVAPEPPAALAPPDDASAVAGRTAPLPSLLTFHPGGSLMSICPAEITSLACGFELDPQPPAPKRTSSASATHAAFEMLQ